MFRRLVIVRRPKHSNQGSMAKVNDLQFCIIRFIEEALTDLGLVGLAAYMRHEIILLGENM